MCMSEWTPAQISDQTGRRILITGANSGIGYYAALELARKGAHILLACRDRGRGEAALGRIRVEIPHASVELIVLDVSSLASVRQVAGGLLERGQPLDVLINNAGIYAPPRRLESADGFELQFATNVLGHFALTSLLLPLIEKTPGVPRIVTVASVVHKRASINFDDLQATRKYSPGGSYGQSKLANLMLAFELDRRLRAGGSPVLSVAAHPGVANTGIFTKGEFSSFELAARKAMGNLMNMLLNSEPSGALPTLFAATAPEAQSGGYYGPQGLLEMRGGDVGPAQVAKQARDTVAQDQLWAVCEELTGVKFL
jgi:NAD(P)-dependent dehydrogenase (short-subunit alcohol dehydrogenase family)